MKTMTLTPTSKPIFIETPAGLVRLDKIKGKSILVTCPECLEVHRGEDRMNGAMRFLKDLGGGRIGPNYSLLSPVVDDDGAIIGLAEPVAFKVRTEQMEDNHDGDQHSENVANASQAGNGRCDADHSGSEDELSG